MLTASHAMSVDAGCPMTRGRGGNVCVVSGLVLRLCCLDAIHLTERLSAASVMSGNSTQLLLEKRLFLSRNDRRVLRQSITLNVLFTCIHSI